MKELIEIRKKQKARKPNFAREDSHKKDKLRKSGWRRPKGHQSKLRLNVKGHRPVIRTGYRSPKAVRGFDRSGLKPNIVYNVGDLKKLDPKTDGAVIGKIGIKNKVEVVKEAQLLKIKLLNVKDINKLLEDIKKRFDEKKKKKEEEAKKEKKGKEKEKPVEKKEEEISEEEKKKKEKEEKDKVLTQKK